MSERAVVDPARHCLPLRAWPPHDRALWEAALAPSDPLLDPRPVLATKTVAKTCQGYGRWLNFLARTGGLDPLGGPADRASPERVGAYLQHLRDLGNRDHTIVSRAAELETALRLMCPDQSWRWIRSPGGVPVRSMLPMRKRIIEVPEAYAVYAWGMQLMDGALVLPGRSRRCVQLRDGLMIALFAARAPRLRSMAALRLGRNLVRHGEAWRLVLHPEDVKTRRHIEYLLPASLTPWVDRYLGHERVELLQGATHDALWVNWGGEPLGYRGVEKRIRWRSQKRYGQAFGPHRFRHALATSAPIEDPGAPGLAAPILGISGRILALHYDLSANHTAGTRFHAGLAAMRSIARRTLPHSLEHGDCND